MSRYIDADALAKEIKQDIADEGLTERFVFYRINEAPSIEIVRCQDCKYGQDDLFHMFCGYHHHKTYADDFCSYGCREERR